MFKTSPYRLPDFIVVGPPRTATTWLDKALRGRVCLPAKTKETHFFARNYDRGLAWYANHFRRCPKGQVIGEICAAYFENSLAPTRIRADLPNCKIICTLRDPVERLYSYYKLMRRNARTDLPFDQALSRHPKMLAFSRYADLLRPWYREFGRENVLVVLNDDLAADPRAYIDRISAFIGISRAPLPDRLIVRNRHNTIETAPRSVRLARNARQFRSWLGANQFYRTRALLGRAGVWQLCFEGGERFSALDPALERTLRKILTPDIEDLEELLGRDLSAWKRTSAGDVLREDLQPLASLVPPELT
jgi:hypothetical protein